MIYSMHSSKPHLAKPYCLQEAFTACNFTGKVNLDELRVFLGKGKIGILGEKITVDKKA